MTTFKDFSFSKELYGAIEKLGFQTPTEIQEKTIPSVLEGKDLLGESATGSGKTLAFGCGIIENTVPHAGLQALILTPTRELAEQVKDVINQLGHIKHLKVLAVYGGVSINPQIEALRTAEVVIATPGRLNDHMQRRTINLSKIKILVLDEADRMLDMGFIIDIEKIINACPHNRQTLLFSATLPPEIEKLSRKYMHNPIKINAVKHVDPSKLKQAYYDVDRNMKLSLLVHLLKKETSSLVMVFCNTRRSTDFLVKNLRLNKVDATALHGGFSQNQRTRSMQQFKEGKENVLVCTDVAARGIDVENITHIYNYEIPKDPNDYVHRIGRTARAGEHGKVINLLCDLDHINFSKVFSQYRTFNIQKMEMPQIERVQMAHQESHYGGGFHRQQHGRQYGHQQHGGQHGQHRQHGGNKRFGLTRK
jgi:ATP-dependent RNA helicase DeaD